MPTHTPNSDDEVAKLTKKSKASKMSNIISAFILLFVIFIVIGLIYRAVNKEDQSCAFILPDALRPGRAACIRLERAETPEARKQGLSYRDNMAPTAGMLFVFDDASQQCIWMKDMHFALDIMWLDESGKITEIKDNITPDTYPQSFCADGKYVVEVLAGTTKRAGLKSGQYLAL